MNLTVTTNKFENITKKQAKMLVFLLFFLYSAVFCSYLTASLSLTETTFETPFSSIVTP